mmetsp:Transcript_2464/g.4898  ORF Transcript_2464/g.4898 Transcript_2464/m.4898 type:complete len:274 (-) Transcript_2464:63-884(-)
MLLFRDAHLTCVSILGSTDNNFFFLIQFHFGRFFGMISFVRRSIRLFGFVRLLVVLMRRDTTGGRRQTGTQTNANLGLVGQAQTKDTRLLVFGFRLAIVLTAGIETVDTLLLFLFQFVNLGGRDGCGSGGFLRSCLLFFFFFFRFVRPFRIIGLLFFVGRHVHARHGLRHGFHILVFFPTRRRRGRMFFITVMVVMMGRVMVMMGWRRTARMGTMMVVMMVMMMMVRRRRTTRMMMVTTMGRRTAGVSASTSTAGSMMAAATSRSVMRGRHLG